MPPAPDGLRLATRQTEGKLMKSSARSLHRSLKLRGNAAGMREHGTASERALWARAASSTFFVVEVDGPYHAAAARQRADARRDRRLGKAGLRVVRVAAELVLGQPELARQIVLSALAEQGR
jgi:very-short-patch-repair endonuclease